MASVSLVSSPPAPVDKHMTDSELAGDEREDGELEDGEINDEGIEVEEENKEATEVIINKEKEKGKGKEKEKEEKSHRYSRKRYKKSREKRKSKRRRRDRQKHHSPSSSSSSDSYDSDYDRPEKPKNRKSQGSNWQSDAPSSQHSKGGHGNSQRSPLHKSSDYDKYSDYSEDKYDYDEEEEDYDDDLSEYQHNSCQGRGRHSSRSLRGMKQQQFGQRGRGRGTGPGRGRALLLKNKKLKGKPWIGQGRGRGTDQEMEEMTSEVKHSSGFPKKRLIMSKEFINQHTVEHNGRYICKYFLEGRCIKGEQCKFEHELVIPEKKKELCKFYLQGYCSKGENCIYMHNEYPCKFFHTGAKCYQGDNCKFSHDALNDVTKELLSKIINTDEENAREDELELEDLRKQGIAPLPKPPPGVGLLPTPGQSSPSDVSSGQAGKKIPSLFEIKVQPTVDLVQKIALSGSNFSQSQGEETSEFSAASEDTQSGCAVPSADAPQSPIPPQSSPGQHPPHVFSMPAPIPSSLPPPFHGIPPNINPQLNIQRPPFPSLPDIHTLQNLFPFSSVNQNPVDILNNLLRNQAGVQQGVTFMQTPQQQMSAELQLQSLPAAIQKAILLHLTQQQQDLHSQGNEPQGANCQEGKTANPDETTNWYSSDEEDGNSVSSILKSLKKQAEIQQQSKPPQATSGTPAQGDPRLNKDRAAPSDPRMKGDPRQRPPDVKKESGGAADLHLSRDPRKVRSVEQGSFQQHIHPAPQKPPTGEEDDDGERELRDRAVLIPLDAAPAVLLQDPRCQLKQFSHIRVDILLQRPNFAQTVVWAPEDLIPSLVPKQEHSINLPLPPLIADAQMNRSSQPDHPPVSNPPPSDPRLAAARLKERIGGLSSGIQELRPTTDRPVDPRQQKCLDPRVKRTGSLDSKLGQKEAASSGGLVDPRLQKVSTAGSSPHPVRAKETERLPPYAPRLASSGGGLGSPTTILGGISLYDPRNQSESTQKEQETPKKAGILKQTVKKDNSPAPSLSPTQRLGFFEEVKSTDTNPEQTPQSSATSPTVPPISPIKAPAVHNLPIQALAGLIRPQYTDPRQAKQGGQVSAGVQEETGEKTEEEQQAAAAELQEEEKPSENEPQQKEEVDESDDRTLKEVFKTFDPTASPFCQ